MVVEDTLQVAHRRLGGGEEDGLTEADYKNGDGRDEPEPGCVADGGGAGHYGFILPRNGLFGVEDGFKEQNADGGVDDVVASELGYPGADLYGVEFACEDAGGGLHHHEKRGQGDGQEDEGEEHLAVAGAEAEGGEEGSVDDEGPCAEGENDKEKPGVTEDVQVEEDDEDGGEDGFDDEDEEEISEGFAEEECGGRGGGHAVGFENLIAELAGPGLVEGGDGGEEEGDPEDAAGDLAGGGGVAGGVECDGEDDNDEEGEEEHAVDGVARAPFEAKVFAEVVEDVANVFHAVGGA